MLNEYIVEMFIDGKKMAGVAQGAKPGVITLKLTQVVTTPPEVTILGSKEIVVP